MTDVQPIDRDAVELAACPFSGHTDSTDNACQESALSVRPFRSPAGGTAYQVECCCGARGKAERTYAEAIAAWNRRASPPVPAGDEV